MTHGSLFSGIGGFDLAAQWMAWQNIFHCEINPFGQKILKHYWPDSISYNDIMDTDFSVHRGTISILSGGFPCQPYSSAGKRLGKADERHLWPYMLRAIQQIQPRWIVGENVYGLTNWNGGLVFNEVQTDLEAEGYEVQPVLLPAASVNAPHRRDRVWFVAYAKSARAGENIGRIRSVPERCDKWKENESLAANPSSIGQQGQGRTQFQCSETQEGAWKASWSYNDGRWPTQSPLCSRNDGIPTGLDNITFSKWRNESIKAYGNAVVPQVVVQIFKTIQAYEDLIQNNQNP
jgi:DNA (cytosine-5)-methyltransferase 1